MQQLSGGKWVGPGVDLECCRPRGQGDRARLQTGVSVVGWGLPGPRRILWDSGWGSGPPTPSAFCEDSERAAGPALCPLPRPRSDCCSRGHVRGWGRMWGACAFRPTSASLPRKGTRGAVFVVLTCQWELCPQPPSWPPPAGARAMVGQPAVVRVCWSGRAAGRGALQLRWEPGWTRPPARSSARGGPGALGALPGCEPPRPAGSSPLRLKSAVS